MSPWRITCRGFQHKRIEQLFWESKINETCSVLWPSAFWFCLGERTSKLHVQNWGSHRTDHWSSSSLDNIDVQRRWVTVIFIELFFSIFSLTEKKIRMDHSMIEIQQLSHYVRILLRGKGKKKENLSLTLISICLEFQETKSEINKNAVHRRILEFIHKHFSTYFVSLIDRYYQLIIKYRDEYVKRFEDQHRSSLSWSHRSFKL